MSENKNNTANNTANKGDDQNKTAKVTIKTATAETLFKDVQEFKFLENIHKKFIEDVGAKKMGDLTGQTTIGNIFCLSSGYVGNKLGSKPSFEQVLKVFSDLFESKNGDVSANVKAILNSFAKAERNGKPAPTFEALSAILDITENDYNTAKEMA